MARRERTKIESCCVSSSFVVVAPPAWQICDVLRCYLLFPFRIFWKRFGVKDCGCLSERGQDGIVVHDARLGIVVNKEGEHRSNSAGEHLKGY